MSQTQPEHELIEQMWEDYISLTPLAKKIHQLLKDQGERIVNDHVALRTFSHPTVNVQVLAREFLELGYEAKDDYKFEQKKLTATHFEHPNETMPKVFISQLELDLCSGSLRETVHQLLESTASDISQQKNFCISGRPWNVSYQTYQKLKEESEYAAWMSAYGFRVNHFTVLVNALEKFDLEGLNSFLKEKGLKLNDSGGEIKGGEKDYLAQSSTLADTVEVEFTDGKYTIPSCYYEFAKRYPLPSGELFTGFVAKSADKIFESTDRSQQ